LISSTDEEEGYERGEKVGSILPLLAHATAHKVLGFFKVIYSDLRIISGP
jgi:hypothetical protein